MFTRLSTTRRSIAIVGLLIIVGAVVWTNTNVNSRFMLSSASDTASGTPTAFVLEAYETIDTHFWKDVSEKQLTSYFVRGIEKLTDKENLTVRTKSQLETTLKDVFANLPAEDKKLPARLVSLVAKSLPPAGRSRLYTKKKEKQLANRVQNVNPNTNLYDVLGVTKQASEKTIKQAAQAKKQQLAQKPNTTTTKQKIREVSYAQKVLTDKKDRKQYDKSKSEPTVFAKRLSPDIVHLGIHRYNKDTLSEFSRAVKSVNMNPEPTSLILDLRSNMGGAIGVLPYLLGPFIGPDRHAYRFFQQGEKEWHKTKTGWMQALVPYKKVVVLVNEKTQSTGELMASVLKKYNVGTVVGETTRGWGTVERVFSLDNQYRSDREYSLFLVHHLTLRSDGQPIQDRGVVPDVRTNNAGWKKELRKHIPHAPLIEAVETVWNTPPPGTAV